MTARVFVDAAPGTFAMTIIDGSDSLVVLRDGSVTKVAVRDRWGTHTAETSPTLRQVGGDQATVRSALHMARRLEAAVGRVGAGNARVRTMTLDVRGWVVVECSREVDGNVLSMSWSEFDDDILFDRLVVEVEAMFKEINQGMRSL